MSLSADWVKHFKTDEERKEFEKILRSSAYVLGRLRDLIKERCNIVEQKEVATSIYDSPSWAYRQAHINGKREEIFYLLKLLGFLDD